MADRNNNKIKHKNTQIGKLRVAKRGINSIKMNGIKVVIILYVVFSN